MSWNSQGGYVLLALLLVVFVSGSSLLLGSLNNRQHIANAQQAETVYQLNKAKEALLAYAANSSTIHSDALGPGYFPCPDTGGTPVPSCDSDEPLIGRLPDVLDIAGTRYNFTRDQLDQDRRFWYVVAPGHVPHSDAAMRLGRIRTSALSPASDLRMNLDGTGNYVALIISTGEALGFQNRSGNENNFFEYSESGIAPDSFSFVSNAPGPGSPQVFNDIVVGITHDEYMQHVGASMAGIIKGKLAAYHDDNLTYPGSCESSGNYVHQDFLDALPSDPMDWMVSEEWSENSPLEPPCMVDHVKMEYMYYTQKSPDTFTLRFFGCNREFEVGISTGFKMSGDSC